MGNDRKFLKKKITEARGNYGNKGPWWYFTLHGLGPGTLPKDVNVVDSVEGVNKKGTRGLFIALDGVLTWQELKDYDLIELAPPKAMQECREGLKEGNEKKWACVFNGDIIDTVMADSEDEAYAKMEAMYPDIPYGESDGIAYVELWDDSFEESLKESKKIPVKKPLKEAKEDDFYFRAFITNLGKYNEGYLIGEWVDFPIDEDKFDEILKKNGIGEDGYDEWFVTDYESNLPGFDWNELGEYTSYDKLQEFGEKIDEINASGMGTAIANAYEVTGDLQQAIDGILNGNIIFYDGVDSAYDLGAEIIEGVYGDNIPEDLFDSYFDYEALGRDLRLEYYQDDDMPETAGEYWAGDENATDREIGEAFVDEVGIKGVANKEYYFDYEGFGNDLTYESFTLTSDGAIEMV